MLVLTRKKAESVRIGGGIEVVVLEVTGKRVRLGFRCPPDVSIQRAEICFDVSALAETSPEGVHRELACV